MYKFLHLLHLTLLPNHRRSISIGCSLIGLMLFFQALNAQQIPLYFQPEQDCINAIPICGGSYSTDDYYLGFGQDLEILPVQNCTTSGELNAVWFIFSIEQSGTLGFTINTDEDYDFMLWNITQYGCATLGQEDPLRCNFSNDDGNTGLNPATTLNSPLGYDSGSPAFMPGIDVQAGQTYALMLNWLWINPFSYDGFSINFSGSAQIVDNASPLPTLTVSACNPGQPLVLTTSTPVDCSTIQASDFSLTGATVTNAEGLNCGSFTTQIEIEYTLNTPATGNFTLTAAGLTDVCNRPLAGSFNFTFPTPIQITATTNEICAGYNEQVTLTSNIAGQWSNGQSGTSITVSPLETTLYTLSVQNGACSRTESFLLIVNPEAFAEISPLNPAICTGGAALLSVTAPAGATVNWTGGPFTGNPTDPTISATPASNTPYSVVVTSAEGCSASNSTNVYAGAPAPDPACVNIYVSPSGNTGGDGSRVDPVDLPTAIGMAQCNNAVLKLAVGTYNFDAPIQLFNYMTIEGGFLPGTDWEKVSTDGTPATTTIINRTTNGSFPYDGIANAPALIAMQGNNVHDFRLQDITLTTANAPASTSIGISTYGLYLNACNNYNIVRCRILPGNASAGANGTNGLNGTNGTNGGNGANGCSADPVGSPSVNCSGNVNGTTGPTATGTGAVNAAGAGGTGANAGGRGGKGGWRTFNFGNGTNNGEIGLAGSGTPAGTGGNGGTGNGGLGAPEYIYDCTCEASAITQGANGTAGTAGTNGANGALSPTTPSYAVLFIPGGQGTNGTDGTNGTGGGGGGGGGGQDATEGTNFDGLPAPFNAIPPISADLGSDAGCGGGGGGGGGGAGTAGTGAYSGGGSFGIFLWANGSSGNIIDCNVGNGTVGAGGNGGGGGTGGSGGIGGQGGNAPNCNIDCPAWGYNVPFIGWVQIYPANFIPDFPNLLNLTPGILNQERDYGDGGDGGNGGSGGTGGNGGNGHAGQTQTLYLNGNPLDNQNIAFNLTAQPVIHYSGQSCVDTDITYTGPTAQAWNLGTNATPQTPSGSSVTTQYNDIGRQNISYGPQNYTGFVNIVLDYVPEAEIYTTAPPIPPTPTTQYRICEGDAVDFQALQPGIDYEWEFLTVSGGPAPSPASYPSNPLNPIDHLDNIIFANAGVYTIRHRVKSDCCGWSEWVEITLNVEPIPDFTLSPQPAYLCGDTPLALNVTINNPNEVNAASVVWTPAVGLSDPNSLSPIVSALSQTTTYTVSMYNLAGNCFHEETITVNVADNLEPIANITPADCAPNGAINITSIQNGIGPYTYQWQTPLTATGASVTGLNIGEYAVSITDNTSGCSVLETFAVNGANTALQVTTLNTNPNCSSGNANGNANIGWFNGVGAFTLTWAGAAAGTANVAAGALNYVIPNLANGAYTVTVSDIGGGCSGTASFFIDTATPLDATIAVATPLTGCNTNDAQLTITPANGTPFAAPAEPYLYAWSHNNALTTPTANGLPAGTYTATITDAANCIITVSTVINTPTVTADFAPISPPCVGTELTLADFNGTQSGTYTWHSATPPTAANTITTLTVLSNTTVYVQYTQNGCSATTPVSINTAQTPSFSVNPTPVCAGNTVILADFNGSGSGTFTWYDAQPSTGNIITNLTPASDISVWVLYTENSCSDSLQVNIAVTPISPPLVNPTPVCEGSLITLANFNGAGSGTYQWFDNMPSVGNPLTTLIATSGITVWVLYTENNCSDSLEVALPITAIPSVNVTSPISVCAGNTAVLADFNGSGSGTYTWFDDIPSVGNTITSISPNTPTTLWVLYTENNCSDSLAVPITIAPPPTFAVLPISTCAGHTLTLADFNGSSTGTFTWYDVLPNGNIITTLAPTNNTTVWVKYEENNCADSLQVNIAVTPTPNLDVADYIAACMNDVLTLNNYNGTGNGQYQWFDGLPSSGNPIQTLAPSTDQTIWVLYTENGCSDSLAVFVDLFSPPTVVLVPPTPLCNASGGANPTSINLYDLITSGDTGGTWADADNSGATGSNGTLDFTTVLPGSYTFTYSTNSAVAPCQDISETITLTVEDCNCPSVAVITTPNNICNTAPTLNLAPLLQTTEAGTWSIGSAPTGSTATVSGNTFNAPSSPAGTYTLSYTLNTTPPAGCPQSTQPITINLNQAPNAGNDATQSVCNASANTIDLNALLGSNADSGGSWTVTSGTPDVGAFNAANGTFAPLNHTAGNFAFTYTVTGTPPCSSDAATVTLQISAAPSATVNPTVQTCNTTAGGALVNLNNNVSNATGTGAWTNLDGVGASGTLPNLNFDGVPTGTYNFGYTLNDPSGNCTPFTATVSVTVNECTCADISLNAPPPICQTSGSIDLLGLMNTPQAGTFAITSTPAGTNPVVQDTNNTLLINNSDAGSYGLTFTLSTVPPGCPATSTTTLNVVPAAAEAGTGSTTTVCNTNTTLLVLSDYLNGESGGGVWTLQSGTPNAGTFDAANGTFNANSHPPTTLTFAYTQTGTPPCTDHTALVTVSIEEAPNAGTASDDNVCTNVATAYSLNNQLNGADAGGTWAIESGNVPTGSLDAPNGVFNAPAGFLGAVSFSYTVLGGSVCNDAVSNFTVNFTAPPNAQIDPSANTCNAAPDNTALDFSTLIIAGDTNGTWQDTDASGASGTFPVLDFSGVVPGTYTFTYTLTATPPCNNAVYTTEILVEDCTCPSVATQSPNAPLCNSGGTLDLTTLQITTEAGTWTVSDAGGAPIALNGNTFDAGGLSAGVYTALFTLNATPAAGCPAFSTQNINVSAAVNAGSDVSQTYCNDLNNNIDLDNLLAGADPNGTWLIASGTPDVGAFDAANATFDLQNHTPGNYDFTYTLTASAPCPSDAATISLSISGALQATLSPTAQICNTTAEGSILDLNTLITSGDTNGTWQDTDASGASGTMPVLDFNGIATGDYTFTYTLSPNPPCNDDVNTVLITVNNCACPDVSTSPAPALCNNTGTLDISTLQVTSEAGTWTVSNAAGNLIPLNGNILEANGLAAGNYTAVFTLNTPPPTGCAESSTQSITINQAANAGIAQDVSLCNSTSDLLNLADQLSGEDNNGTWSLTNGTIDPSAFDPIAGTVNISGQSASTLVFTYLVTAEAPCASSSANVSLTISEAQSAIVVPAVTVCNAAFDGSILNFGPLVSNATGTPIWADTDGSGASGTFPVLDFAGVLPGTYTFTCTIAAANPCADAIFITEVTVENCACPSVATTPVPNLCNDSGSIDLSSFALTTESGTWTLSDAGGANVPLNGTIFEASGAEAGNYTAIFTLNAAPIDACPDSSVQTFTVFNAPQAGTPDNITLCNNTPDVLVLNDYLNSEDSNGTWTLTSGTADAGAFDAANGTLNAENHSPAILTFTYTVAANGPCNAATTALTITLNDCNCSNPPAPIALNDTLQICQDTPNTALFEASATPNTVIVWYNAANPLSADSLATGNTYLPTEAGTYYAVAYNLPNDGCFSPAVPFVLLENALPNAALFAPDDTLCVGNNATFGLNNAPIPTATYTWAFENGTPATATGSSASAEWTTAGNHTVTLTAEDNGCATSMSVEIAVSSISVSISPTATSLEMGGSVVLEAVAISGLNTPINYTWLPASTLSCADCSTPTATPTETTVYNVTAADAFGCAAAASATVSLVLNNTIVIPNAFSPNNDGQNDVFRISGANVASIDLQIYNRWGNKLYSGQGDLSSTVWDGRYKGNDVEIGVLVYIATATFADGSTETYKGNLTLVR